MESKGLLNERSITDGKVVMRKSRGNQLVINVDGG